MDMPRPKCKDPLCRDRAIKGSSYCDAHRKESYKAYESERQDKDGFYNSRTWRRIRLLQLSKDPLCAECKRQNRVTGASIADHIVAIKDGGDRYSSSNLQSLCTRCHNAKRGREGWSRR